MAELEMLPAWAGRLAEPSPPPQPPTPPRRYATDEDLDGSTDGLNGSADSLNGSTEGVNGTGPAVATYGDGPAVLTGQPPLPSGEHRIDAAAATTSELPVVSIPFEDETSAFDGGPTPAPEPLVGAIDPLVDTLEVPADDVIVDAELIEELEEAGAELAGEPGAEVVELGDIADDEDVADVEDAEEIEDEAAGWMDASTGSGEAPRGEGLADGGDQPAAGHAYLDEIVYEPDEIELLEDTDPIGIAPTVQPPPVIPTVAADTGGTDGQTEPAERDRPVLRVVGFLALALLVVAAGVAAGYLFVALTGS